MKLQRIKFHNVTLLQVYCQDHRGAYDWFYYYKMTNTLLFY